MSRRLKMAVLLSRPDAQALCWDLPLDQWKMPNDLPPQAASADSHPGPQTTIQPKELGFTITLQRFIFDPQRPAGTGHVFRGFPTPPPVAPLQSPDPVLKRLPHLTPSKPPRLSGPGPLPAPALGKADQVRWNLVVAATPGHSGKILILPTGQLHEGPGSAGVPSASYHWHPLDRRTGIHVATAIPLDRSLKPIGVVPQAVLDTLSQEFLPGSLREPVQDALASGNWRQVVKTVSASPEALLYPVPRLAYAHAMIELNRTNEAAALFASVQQKLALVAWAEFAGEFVEKHPDNAVAHYLLGDSHARFKEWDRAEVEFTSALRLDPELHLARSALAVVHIAQGKRDLRCVALTDLTQTYAHIRRRSD